MVNAQEDHNRMNAEKKKKNRKETYELIQLCPPATPPSENGMNSFNSFLIWLCNIHFFRDLSGNHIFRVDRGTFTDATALKTL